ncbi:hypothetical protein [Candidatus Colwellia aromaticivorans]|uniref:hypothetical protein n=1 Tax=Candidatus Colwellia aromaticivorans TaxID=2267621 RepID=UPI000DF2731C|nr:hypothetical protein [Candidatus Colwellia aromaticivorans]
MYNKKLAATMKLLGIPNTKALRELTGISIHEISRITTLKWLNLKIDKIPKAILGLANTLRVLPEQVYPIDVSIEEIQHAKAKPRYKATPLSLRSFSSGTETR